MKASKPTIIPSAQDTFTDREEPRRVFWEIYDNMEPGDVQVLDFYGVGGVGKTTLLKKLQQEMSEEGRLGREGYIYYNFENLASKDEFLYFLSRQMMLRTPKMQFPVFDTAFIRLSQMAGRDIDKMQEQLEKTVFDREGVAKVLDMAGDFLPFSNVTKTVARKQ